MVSDGYALLDNHILVDFERRIPLWEYNAGGRLAGAVAPTGVLWYTVTAARNSPLTPLRLPNAEALAEARKLKADDLLLLKPGAKVALAVNAQVEEADRQAITQSLKDQLTQAKLVLDNTSPIRIVASNEQGKTTEMEYRPFGSGPFGAGLFAPAQKVTVTPMITRLAIEMNGKTVWQATSLTGASFMLHLKEGQNLEQAVAEASKVDVQFLKDVKVPVYLTKPHEPAWYGSSRL